MKDSSGMMKNVVLVVLGLGIGIVGWRTISPVIFGVDGGMRELIVPQLSAAARKGQRAFEENCISCHGKHAIGTDQGPPLIHDYYNPGHHADGAFYLAAARGVVQHHWNFGDMKPVEGMTPKKMDRVVPYVRYYQKQKKLY